MKAIYVSEWNGGYEVRTHCLFNEDTLEVSDVESVDVSDEVEYLDKEYIELPNGDRKEVLNFDNFQDKWLEQECDKTDDNEQLKEEIADAMDFEDIFQVIGLWSHKPLKERVREFLERNNAVYIID